MCCYWKQIHFKVVIILYFASGHHMVDYFVTRYSPPSVLLLTLLYFGSELYIIEIFPQVKCFLRPSDERLHRLAYKHSSIPAIQSVHLLMQITVAIF